MSLTRALVLTVAAAAATTILALQYFFCVRRADTRPKLGKTSGTEQDQTGETCCGWPKTLRNLSRRISRTYLGGVSEPLLAEIPSSKTNAVEDNLQEALPGEAVDYVAGFQPSSMDGAATDLLHNDSHVSKTEAAVLQPIPTSNPKSYFADTVSPDPPQHLMEPADCEVHQLHLVEIKESDSKVSTDISVLEVDISYSGQLSNNPEVVEAAPEDTEDQKSQRICQRQDAAMHIDAASPQVIFADGTGTLIACGRPHVSAAGCASDLKVMPTPFPTLVASSEPLSQQSDSSEILDSSQKYLESQPTLVNSCLSALADGMDGKSPRPNIEVHPARVSQKALDPAASPTNIGQNSTVSLKPRVEFAVVVGPSKGTVFATTDIDSKVHIGRLPQCHLALNDNEVSGSHCVVVFSGSQHCWKLADVGSLNGTHLNGQLVSKENRRPGDLHILLEENVVKLGTSTQIRIKCYTPPHERAVALSNLRAESAEGHRRHLFRNKIDFAPLRLKGCIVTRTGREHKRRSAPSEDLVHFEVPFRQFQQAGLFCVFDGHNGRQAAELAKHLIPEELASNVNGALSLLGEGSCQEALEAAFLAADARLSADEGCTATAVVAECSQDGTVLLQIANVGDSAAVLVNAESDSPGVKLTEDHRVVNPVEKERLKKKGFKGTTRLFGLALSRSMGDKFLKDVDVGLIAKPYVCEMVSIKPEDSGILVVASDGLWDVVTPERATKLVRTAMAESPSSVDHIAERLLLFAVEHQSHDDITVMVLKFDVAAPRLGTPV